MTYWQYAGIALCIGIPLLLISIHKFTLWADRWLTRRFCKDWMHSYYVRPGRYGFRDYKRVRIRL